MFMYNTKYESHKQIMHWTKIKDPIDIDPRSLKDNMVGKYS